MKINPLFILILFILPIVFADSNTLSDYYTYAKIGQSNLINLPCVDLSVCPTASCNISITDPNGNSFTTNAPMSYSSPNFHYTMSSASILGDYHATATCSNSLYSIFHIIINYSGNAETVNPLTIATIILLFLLAVGALVWAFAIEWDNKFSMGTDDKVILEINYGKYAKLFLFFFSYLFFWLDIYLIWQAIRLVTFNTFFPDLFYYLFWVSTILIFPLVFVVFVIGMVKWLADSELLKLHKRNLNPR